MLIIANIKEHLYLVMYDIISKLLSSSNKNNNALYYLSRILKPYKGYSIESLTCALARDII